MLVLNSELGSRNLLSSLGFGYVILFGVVVLFDVRIESCVLFPIGTFVHSFPNKHEGKVKHVFPF